MLDDIVNSRTETARPDFSATAIVTVGVVRESAHGERRVALDPRVVATLLHAGRSVLVESGAGPAASFSDDADYVAAGAAITPSVDAIAQSDVIAIIRTPDEEFVNPLHAGQVLIGLLDPLHNPEQIGALAQRGFIAVAFELLPRTLGRARAVDVMSSQSPNVSIDDVARGKDDFSTKALDGFTMFALNTGEICPCPCRALLQKALITGGFLSSWVRRRGRPSPPVLNRSRCRTSRPVAFG